MDERNFGLNTTLLVYSLADLGAWGTYPFFHSGNIAISDIGNGFYMAADRTRDVSEGSFAFSSRSYGGEEGSQIQIAVGRTGGSTGNVSVRYEILPTTGDRSDITGASGILVWSDGDTAPKTIDIALLNDGTSEGLERMLIKLREPTGGATLGSSNVAGVYISEPGAQSVVGFDQSTINIAERGFATAVAVIERTGSAVGASSVDYALSAGDADAGIDFVGATNGTINWAAGDADPKWLEFAIADDGVAESAEFIELTLSNAVNAAVGSQPTLRINIANGIGVNNAPNAVAGASQTAASGATVTLSNAATAAASFVAPTVNSDRILRFELTVMDNGGLDNKSTTSVTVRKAGDGKSGGSGGGSLGWLMLMMLIVIAILFEWVALDYRLFPIRSR